MKTIKKKRKTDVYRTRVYLLYHQKIIKRLLATDNQLLFLFFFIFIHTHLTIGSDSVLKCSKNEQTAYIISW